MSIVSKHSNVRGSYSISSIYHTYQYKPVSYIMTNALHSLILSSHLCLGLPCGLFPSVFRTKTLYTPLLSLIRAISPAHHILLDFITQTILAHEYRSLSYS